MDQPLDRDLSGPARAAAAPPLPGAVPENGGTVRWQPDRSVPPNAPDPLPPFFTALGRGAMNRCPVCGVGKVFAGYLRVVPACSHCGTPLGELRADDAPPYFTIFIVGHLLLPPVFWVEAAYEPPMWVHMAIWLPLFAAACTLLLRPVKGATVGLMLKLGFGGGEKVKAELEAGETGPLREPPPRG
ncbi:DUF983 domain-containing protein [Roseomonas sp. BN140053]|uniref:DUF983 domain-containing protein n=1 Tax=Roseomonas sp. BN140053 TaxID=3391898 RepID=UPI0039EB3599